MKLGIGSDHAGYRLKERIAQLLKSDGHDVVDYGTDSEESVDYPDFAARVGHAVVARNVDRGVLICGSGNGVAIAANKVRGVRAAVAHDVTSARLACEHNAANVCCFGARFLGEQTVEDAVRAYLAAKPEGGRHARRVEKIAAIEHEDTKSRRRRDDT